MTKPALRAACLGALALACALAPTAAAHGAPPSRELDTRILTDADGLAYGAGGVCVPGAPAPCLADTGAVDLLALDVRELALPDGAPAVAFRVVHQYDTVHEGRTIAIDLEVAGGPARLVLTSADGVAYTADGYDVLGPEDVGDGHPKAIDIIVPLANLGARAGDALTNVRVTSAGAEPGDLMPGTWNLQGSPVPATPGEDGQIPAAEPGSYTLRGPAALLRAEAPATATVPHHGAVTLEVKVTSTLAATEQFVTAEAKVGTLGSPTAKLAPGASATFTLTIPASTAATNATLVLRSDLGAYHVVDVPLLHAPAPTMTGDGHQHTHATHDETAQDAPAGMAPLALALAALLGRRRA